MFSVYFKHKNSNHWHLEKATISLEACITAFRELIGGFNVIDEMIVKTKRLLVRDSIQYRIVESDAQILTDEQCNKLFRNNEELQEIKTELNKITDAKVLKKALLFARNQVENVESLIERGEKWIDETNPFHRLDDIELMMTAIDNKDSAKIKEILKKYEQKKIMDQHAKSGKFGIGGNFEPSLEVETFLEEEEILLEGEKWLDEKNLFRDDLKDAEKMMLALENRDISTIKQILNKGEKTN